MTPNEYFKKCAQYKIPLKEAITVPLKIKEAKEKRATPFLGIPLWIWLTGGAVATTGGGAYLANKWNENNINNLSKQLEEQKKETEELQKKVDTSRGESNYTLGGTALGGGLGAYFGPDLMPDTDPTLARVTGGLLGGTLGGVVGSMYKGTFK